MWPKLSELDVKRKLQSDAVRRCPAHRAGMKGSLSSCLSSPARDTVLLLLLLLVVVVFSNSSFLSFLTMPTFKKGLLVRTHDTTVL